MDVKKRLFLVLLAIFIVTIAGSIGYFLLYHGESNFLDCLYMTVISLTGVGYGEIIRVTGNVPAEIFTMVLIISGMGIIFYGISALAALIIEGELSGMLRRKTMLKKINKLKDHYIVCGGGETGRALLVELVKNEKTAVLIEASGDAIERCKAACDIFHIKGDATDDQNLIAAGVANAAGIAVCIPSDKDCLYVTMTARMFNKKLRIISRMADPKHKAKLKMVGADAVVSPNAIGALRMASEMIRPDVVDFLDRMLRSKSGTLRINQITVSEHSPVNGKSIEASRIKEDFSLLILGIKEGDEEVAFNPPAEHILKSGMTVILMGDVADVNRAAAVL